MTGSRSDFAAIGWPPAQSIAEALRPWPDAQLARVVAQHRSGYELAQHPDHSFRAQAPAGWLRPRTDPELRAVVGDWVALDAAGKQILGLLPRHALLKRAAAGEHFQQQLIAANIDHVLLVSGMDADFNAKRIERYLLLIAASGAKPVLVLTKLDILDGLPELKVCVGYRIDGELVRRMPAGMAAQAKAQPEYEVMEGWSGSTKGARSWAELPAQAVKYVKRIEELVEAPVTLVSTSPERDDTILVRDPFEG